MKQTIVPIKGMHCRSCELLIEDELKEIRGVKKVRADQKKCCAVVYHADELDNTEVSQAVQRAGYDVGINEKSPWFSTNLEDYVDVMYAAFALGLLYIIADAFELGKIFSTNVSQPTNLMTVGLIGLTAGFSTCMALIGGLVLGVSARYAEQNTDADKVARFTPHVFFNIGRVASYVLFGGVIGMAGSIFQLSGMSLGLMTLAVALVMLTLGLQLTNLFPRLENFKLTLPSSVSRRLGISSKQKDYSHKNTMLMGASTFFLPCGFTQAMQLYAISTGSFVSGAAIMGMFALGTAPGLLGIGGLTSVLKGPSAQKFFKFAGVVVIALSVFNLRNGLNLIGWTPGVNFPTSASAANKPNIVREGQTQIINMEQNATGYVPSKLVVVKGVPVKWIVNSTNQYSCASSILASKIGVQANLKPGENVFEFTPTEVGTIPFSCSMGMYRGVIEVVESGREVRGTSLNQQPVGAQESCGGSGGCGAVAQKLQDSPSEVVKADQQGQVQLIKTVYTAENDIFPNTFEVKKNLPVRFEIDAQDDGVGCMSSIMVPGLTRLEPLQAGDTIAFEFTPTQTGEVPITCGMGMPRGIIKIG